MTIWDNACKPSKKGSKGSQNKGVGEDPLLSPCLHLHRPAPPPNAPIYVTATLILDYDMTSGQGLEPSWRACGRRVAQGGACQCTAQGCRRSYVEHQRDQHVAARACGRLQAYEWRIERLKDA